MSAADELDRHTCGRCDLGREGYSVRVTGGSLAGAHLSTYACDDCAPTKAAIIRSEFPDDTQTVALPSRVTP